ncbi:SDR family oxidoreductase [Paenibacillus senegalensis]|uniref:SDR family oxidoreductase n=1 Tax=Paenibacillus senegalensis TaxID=1465766 RepID=UPI0002880EE9|nr:SDR family oxidoreductase [Paenibacillus senegalensis]
MKVLVVGANGKIGRQLVKLLAEEKHHQVRAMVRKEEQMEKMKQLGAEPVLADLSGRVQDIAEAARGCDAVVFTAGSGGHTGADQTILIDLDGAVKTVEATKLAGIDRFVMVSAIGANKREKWSDKIKHYHAAKYYADEALKASGLNYTIVRPGALLDSEGSGKISAAEELDRGSIPRADVAQVLAVVLDEPNTYRRSFDLVSGDTAITDALKYL